MPSSTEFSIFLSTAILLAITPGSGIFYVLTRSLKGGRGEGYASSLGTGVGGLFHVVAGALGLSAILASSAIAFSLVKYLGALYLIYLGIQAILHRHETLLVPDDKFVDVGHRRAFYQGVTTEMLNPKTALFFLAFVPQFINLSGSITTQFILLGCISVFLNTSVDVIVATLAGPIGHHLKTHPRLRQFQSVFTGSGLVALGLYVALADSD